MMQLKPAWLSTQFITSRAVRQSRGSPVAQLPVGSQAAHTPGMGVVGDLAE